MITITPPAARYLLSLFAREPDGDRLGLRIQPMTSGCGSHQYGLSLTEPDPRDRTEWIEGVPVLARDEDRPLIEGLVIDWNADTGRLSLYHPRPPQGGCELAPSQDNRQAYFTRDRRTTPC